MSPGRTTVSEVGEDGVVAMLGRVFESARADVGIGDDAAVLSSPGGRLVLTTDTLVEGHDFELTYCTGADIGWKATAVNVSDVAAMGAEPSHAVATLCLPSQTPMDVVEDMARGLAQAAREWDLDVVGGDLSGAGALSLGMTLLGHCEEPVLRSGARPGDALCLTGSVGGAHAGLKMLQEDPHATGPLVDRQRRPRARLAEGRAVSAAGATAMIDVSDGIVVDLDRLMSASGTGCSVDLDALPIDPNLLDQHLVDPLDAALYGGEDFELLFSIDADRLASIAGKGLAAGITRIGTVTDGERRIGDRLLGELKEGSWDHLRGR